ncbi:MAG: hypothetical protein ABJN14_12905 [Paracoccaceae bacterium]
MTHFTGFSHILARESIRLNCFCSLQCELVEKELSPLFTELDRLHDRFIYLNDDDEQRPPVKIRRQQRTIFVETVIYEGAFGKRDPDTDDFDSKTVASVTGEIYATGYLAVIDKMSSYFSISHDDVEARKCKIQEIMSEFVKSFDPTKSLLFGPQPKRNRQKFWITPPLGVDPLAFRHD